MFPTSVAKQYARALVQTARGREDLRALASGLHEAVGLLASEAALLAALRNPAVPPARKMEIVRGVLGGAGASPLLASFLSVVIGKGHLAGLEAIDGAVAREVAEALGVVRAEIRVAHPLGDDDLERVTRALERAVGKKVEARVSVDPSLLGGFVAKAGDLVFDGSLKRQVERLRGELVR
jgi:F-type H+-transporting ATPase subunit delta